MLAKPVIGIMTEILWLAKRRTLRLTVVLSGCLVAFIVLGRTFTTNNDIATAIKDAQAAVDHAATLGLTLQLSQQYVDPRYHLASQLPSDIAAIGTGLALLFLIAAIINIGGDWRNGTIRLSFEKPHRRVLPTVNRLCAWLVAGLIASLFALSAAIIGLSVLAKAKGFSTGVTPTIFYGPTLRALLVLLFVIAVGGFLGNALRSDMAGALVLVAYLVIFELVLTALLRTSGYFSPSSQAFFFISGEDNNKMLDIYCGDVPVCPATFAQAPSNYLIVGSISLGIIALVFISGQLSRRAIWR